MHLNHITLSTGHTARTSRADVTDGTIAALRPWLDAAIAYQDDYPLPGPLGVRDGYRATVYVEHGALVCTVFGPPLEPLVTFGVAERSRQSAELWAMLVAQFGCKTGLQAPGTPWCAVVIHPAYALQHGVSAWIGDFERCVAWTWL
jgi:hypothetical protein